MKKAFINQYQYIKSLCNINILSGNTNLDQKTQTIIWALVVTVSAFFIIVLLLIHFLWWKNKFANSKAVTMRVGKERGIFTEIKGNIFLIISSLFAISLIIGIISLIKINI